MSDDLDNLVTIDEVMTTLGSNLQLANHNALLVLKHTIINKYQMLLKCFQKKNMKERAFLLRYCRSVSFNMDGPFVTQSDRWTFKFYGKFISWNPHDKVWELFKVYGWGSPRDGDTEVVASDKCFSCLFKQVIKEESGELWTRANCEDEDEDEDDDI